MKQRNDELAYEILTMRKIDINGYVDISRRNLAEFIGVKPNTITQWTKTWERIGLIEKKMWFQGIMKFKILRKQILNDNLSAKQRHLFNRLYLEYEDILNETKK